MYDEVADRNKLQFVPDSIKVKSDCNMKMKGTILLVSDIDFGIYSSFLQNIHIEQINDKNNIPSFLSAKTWDLIILDIDILKEKTAPIISDIRAKDKWVSILIISEIGNNHLNSNIFDKQPDGFFLKSLNESFIEFAIKLSEKSRNKRKSQQKIILAIGAHPDDIEIGTGGTLSFLKSEGHIINFLTLSLGELGGDPKQRKHECYIAAGKIDATLFLNELKDTRISDSTETIGLIEQVVDHIRPTHVYTHSMHDNHQDHRSTYFASMVACRSVQNLFCYQSPSSTVDFKPSLFVEISKTAKKKVELIECYKSQQDIKPYLRQETIYSTAQYWGRYCNYGLAEPFEVIRIIDENFQL